MSSRATAVPAKRVAGRAPAFSWPEFMMRVDGPRRQRHAHPCRGPGVGYCTTLYGGPGAAGGLDLPPPLFGRATEAQGQNGSPT